MRTRIGVLHGLIAASLGLAAPAAWAAAQEETQPATVESLKNEIQEMKRDYEDRLRALEDRVEAAEKSADQAKSAAEAANPPEGSSPTGSVGGTLASASRAFNPSVSAILQGRASYLEGGDGSQPLSGYPLGGKTDRGRSGLALGESELVFSANVDDKLYGFLDVSFDQSDIGVEEAYFTTLSLPGGFGLKGGKFLSSIGYHNDRHSHTWDFVDAPLVYEAMLDTAYSDPGVQLTWVAPTDLFFQLGAEVFRGDAYPAGGAANHGFGSASVFAKLAGDLDESNSWKAGLSYLRADSDGRESEALDGSSVLFDGSSDLFMADLVWKWAPFGNFHDRNFTFQTEYMHRRELGRIFTDFGNGHYRGNQDGFYVQGVYQFMPRWRLGLRYGELWGNDELPGLPSGLLVGDGSSPRRISTMLDFSNSEFSRIRLQYSFESGGLGDDSLVYLQYILSIGSHGAHTY